ncbi:MAG: 30S ribosomal protein S8 [Gammaproteobacteria bacterium]
MSMHDPVADLLTRIRNAQRAEHREVAVPASRLKGEVARVLKEEGYIEDYRSAPGEDGKPVLTIRLKYYEGRPVIERLQRVSRPGLRVFRGKDDLPRVSGGYGVAIISTSHGLMSDRAARAAGHGGEVLCEVS